MRGLTMNLTFPFCETCQGKFEMTKYSLVNRSGQGSSLWTTINFKEADN